LFISHDLLVVEHLCNRIAVMYLGRILELSPAQMIFEQTLHPYTQALLAASPIPDPNQKRKESYWPETCPVPSRPPDAISIPVVQAFDRCQEERPILRELRPNHFVSCFLYE
jgi:oligopeptide/dipeptide ABC transporter ATP-binding protein